MGFCRFSKDYKSRKYTEIENKFIRQFLPEADADALKVYLLGIFVCQSPDSQLMPDFICSALKISENEVLEAFSYWEDFGLVNILSEQPLTVEYLPVDSAYKNKRINTDKYAAFAKEVQLIITERMVTPNEFSEYFNLLETYSMQPEAMLLIIKYCVDMKGGKINYRYITTVIKNYAEQNILTFEQIEKELSDYISGGDLLNKIYRVLKIEKKPDIEDQMLLKKWTGEYLFSLDTVLHTASRIKGGMKKLDSTLSELYTNRRLSEKEIDDYLKNKKKYTDFAYTVVNMFHSGSVNIQPYLENYFSRWSAKGYSEDGIMFIAKVCFRNNKKSLEDVNNVIEGLYAQGVVGFESISQHFSYLANENKFIGSIFEIVGINRRPTSWDRDNLGTWRKWNFSDTMIIEAAKRSASVSNPIPYMNAILSNWKNSGIFTPDEIKDTQKTAATKKRFAAERSYSQEEMDEIIKSFDDVEI